MRALTLLAAAVLTLSACTASDTPEPDQPSPSASSSPSASADKPDEVGWKLVSDNLGVEGGGQVTAGAGSDASVVAAVRTSGPGGDVGFTYSTDEGKTWKWSGAAAVKGGQNLTDVFLYPGGAIGVGSTKAREGGTSRALVVVGTAPEYKALAPDLGEEFSGDVELVDMFEITGSWIIVGQVNVQDKKTSGKGKQTRSVPTVWFSNNSGATWDKGTLNAPGTYDVRVNDFALGNDGSWNIFGENRNEGQDTYDGAWLRSTDTGSSWQLVDPEAFTKAGNQSIERGYISNKGDVALLGWDTEDSGRVSVMWRGSVEGQVSRMGTGAIPVSGGAPPGQFAQGALFDQDTIVLWGNPEGEGPGAAVQFWAWDGMNFIPTTRIEGEVDDLRVEGMLTSGDVIIALGENLTPEQQPGIWRAELGQ